MGLEAQKHKALLLQVCVAQQVPGALSGSHAAQPLARQHRGLPANAPRITLHTPAFRGQGGLCYIGDDYRDCHAKCTACPSSGMQVQGLAALETG